MIHISMKGQGSPIVFFHGWGFDHSIWYELVEDLQTSYTVYLVDLPGHGLSDMCSWSDFAGQLLDMLPERFAIVGWSLGGLYATRLAVEHSQRITHLINVGSSPKFIASPNWPGISEKIFKSFFQNLSLNPKQTVQQFIDLQLQDIQACQYVETLITPPIFALKNGLEVLSSWDLIKALSRLNMPVLYIFGRLDAIVPRTTKQALKKLYPKFEYDVYLQSAHIPFLSQKKQFIEQIRAFI